MADLSEDERELVSLYEKGKENVEFFERRVKRAGFFLRWMEGDDRKI